MGKDLHESDEPIGVGQFRSIDCPQSSTAPYKGSTLSQCGWFPTDMELSHGETAQTKNRSIPEICVTSWAETNASHYHVSLLDILIVHVRDILKNAFSVKSFLTAPDLLLAANHV